MHALLSCRRSVSDRVLYLEQRSGSRDWRKSILTKRGSSIGVAMARPMKRRMSLRACIILIDG